MKSHENRDNQKASLMLDSASHQQQLWIVERLERICRVFRQRQAAEPCLEQYESEVSLVMGEPVTEAAAAWIELIVLSLRRNERFEATEFISTVTQED